MLACLCGLAAVCSFSSESLPPANATRSIQTAYSEITLWPQNENMVLGCVPILFYS